MRPHFRFDFTFPRDYEVKMLETAPLPHPVEKLYHYPMELEEGDRTGIYLRVQPKDGIPWAGFFALGFDSPQVVNAICSCPDPQWLCAVVGGYAYLVNSSDPQHWLRLEQSPVMDLRCLSEQQIILFAGFTSITAVGRAGVIWTTERLSWEGLTITEVDGAVLRGMGWDAPTDKEVPFELDLRTGRHTGGARPSGHSV